MHEGVARSGATLHTGRYIKSLDKSCLGGFRYTSDVGAAAPKTGQATAHWQARWKAKSKSVLRTCIHVQAVVRPRRMGRPVERSWAKGGVCMKQWPLCLIPALAIRR